MTKKQRLKSTGANAPVPQNNEQAGKALREIGELSREVLRLKADMNDEIAEVKQRYGDLVAPIAEKSAAKSAGLQIYCEANRDELTKNGKVKFHRFPTGEISWRSRPAKVTLTGVKDVVDRIRAAGLGDRFLRTKVEVNKEAMLEDPDAASAIQGVKIGSEGEDFIVEPFETDLGEGTGK
jgi:phage host-nuclease inhibitor protein Gam